VVDVEELVRDSTIIQLSQPDELNAEQLIEQELKNN
jgi:hypothetical protein